MKFKYSDKEEWETLHKVQLIRAVTQAAAVAIGILLCALITLFTGCRSHKAVITEQTTATTTVATQTDTSATTRDSTRTLTTWHTVRTDTTAAQTWHTIGFAPAGGTLTIDSAGTLHATNVASYIAHAKTAHTAMQSASKTADSTAVAAHSITAHASRDTAYTEASTTTTAAPCTRRHVTWASALIALLIAAVAAAAGAWAEWKRQRGK